MRLHEYNAAQARGMSEKDFQAQVIEIATALGWKHYHTHNSQRSVAGFPDLVLVHPIQRRLIFRELKTTSGAVSIAQREWIEYLRACGQDIAVWRPGHLVSGEIARSLAGGGSR